MKKKILIIGNSVKESALARKLVEKHDVLILEKIQRMSFLILLWKMKSI